MSIQRALEELESIVDSQWKNGMLPHIRFVKKEEGYSPDAVEWGAFNQTKQDIFETSGITQPPVMGLALEKICNHPKASKYVEKIINIVQATESFHDFLFEYRDPYNENLVCIVHPWESGLDNSPIYDRVNESAKEQLDALNIQQQIKKRKDINRVIADFRPGQKDYEVYGKLMGYFKHVEYDQLEIAKSSPFRVQDVLYNLLLLRSMKALLSVYEFLKVQLPQSSFQIHHDKNQQKIVLLENAMYDKFYDESTGCFFAYDMNAQTLLKYNTIQSLMAQLYFCKQEDLAVELIEMYQQSDAVHFMSTSDKEHCFDPLKYWRGPVWPVTNWLIIDDLKHKFPKLAQRYAQKSMDLICEGIDEKKSQNMAMQLMYFNLVFDRFTTPSKNQYKHGWLWDSVFAAIGWLYVKEDIQTAVYQEIMDYKAQQIQSNNELYAIRQAIKKKFEVPLFDEYYVAQTTNKYPIKAPIGSEMMTWTAAVYLDLYAYMQRNNKQ